MENRLRDLTARMKALGAQSEDGVPMTIDELAKHTVGTIKSYVARQLTPFAERVRALEGRIGALERERQKKDAAAERVLRRVVTKADEDFVRDLERRAGMR